MGVQQSYTVQYLETYINIYRQYIQGVAKIGAARGENINVVAALGAKHIFLFETVSLCKIFTELRDKLCIYVYMYREISVAVRARYVHRHSLVLLFRPGYI